MRTNDAIAMELAAIEIKTEKQILHVLMDMDAKKEFQALGYTGIFNYCLHRLKLSESRSNYYATVARKAKEVPELKTAIDQGVINLSKARRIAPVITKATQEAWITKAVELPQRELEQEVAAVNPRSVRERVKPISLDRHEVRLSITDTTRRKLDRVRDLLKTSSLEEVLERLLDEHIKRHDPVEKAKRTVLRKVKPGPRHQVHLRDQGKCQVKGCTNRRYIELHHKIPKAIGGPDTADNLITLCSAHHKMWHRNGTDFLHEAKSAETCEAAATPE